MKAMLLSDLIVMRRSLVSLVAACFLAAAIMTVASDSSLAFVGGCFGAMIPLLYLMSVAAYDELANWQVYRLTLPMSRKNAVVGRYASVLLVVLASAVLGVIASYAVGAVVGILAPALAAGSGSAGEPPLSTLALSANPADLIWGSAIGGASGALFLGAITLPVIARFGLRKGTRFIPIVGVLFAVFAITLFKDGGPLSGFAPEMVRSLLSGGSEFALVAVLAAVSLALYAISLPISIRLYSTREF